MRRNDETDTIQRLTALAAISGAVYPDLRDLCLAAAGELQALRRQVSRQGWQHGRSGRAQSIEPVLEVGARDAHPHKAMRIVD